MSWYLSRMTQRWGLDLSSTAVRLMRRDAGHWHEIASENMEGDDLDTRLRALSEAVPDPREVDIFLPRDQILYTNVKVTDKAKAASEVEAAVVERTPYTADEMEIDWDFGASGEARVAAIARVTLEEAEAFTQQFGLAVRRFSALADSEDFPRNPDFGTTVTDAVAPFGTPEKASPETESGSEAEAEAEDKSGQAPLVLTATNVAEDTTPRTDPESGPVVHVDTPDPVVEVSEDRIAPLDPGPALPRDGEAPKVRTDVALPEAGGDAAASLSPPPTSPVYGKSEVPPARRVKGLAFGLAGILTMAIAIIIWAILPDAPDLGEARTDGVAEDAVTAAIPDAPQPDVTTDIVAEAGEIPETPNTPVAPTAAPTESSRTDALPSLPVVTTEADTPPAALPDPVAHPDMPQVRMAALAPVPPIAATPGLTPEQSDPPRTLPGNVALPMGQAFSPGVPPPPGQAPAYVSPEVFAETTGAEDGPQPDDTDLASLSPADPEDAVAVPEVPTLPTPTELAAAIPDIPAAPRPSDFVQEVERQIFGGLTRSELSELRPPGRPQSAQGLASAERGNAPPTALAVATAPAPRLRPGDMETIVARAEAAEASRIAAAREADTDSAVRAALEAEADEEATTPRNSPRLAIPSTGNVARQATIEDGISLGQLNLVGVYGLPSDRRALIRLSSGRYVKVKIGDRIDGGTIAAITDSALQYNKGGRVIQLTMPQG